MLPPRRAARLAFTAFTLTLALVATACGGGEQRTTTSRGSPGASAATTAAPVASPMARSSPRWETVTTFRGSGPTETPEFAIVANAIQWRVRWTCETGTLRITTDPPPRRPAPIAESACPANGHGFAIHTGAIRLGVETGGGWSAVVDQQVDTPLDEAPPAGAASTRVVAEGRFHPVEKPGKGRSGSTGWGMGAGLCASRASRRRRTGTSPSG